ncbi:hypothetical protein COO72_02500 [Bifidobacterium callitrichos]|nr:hypothetical protein COO72_02500 [Bifidobacterium callitrichos]
MLITGPYLKNMPPVWEHTPSTPTRHGAVAQNPMGGYVATLRVTRPDGTDQVQNRMFPSLDDAERWLMDVVNDMPAPALPGMPYVTGMR